MPTRNVVLTERLSGLIDRLVKSGRYQNASEVLREGLRLIEAREAQEQAKLEALRAAVRVGVGDIEAGRFRTFESRADLEVFMERLTDDVLAGRGAKKAS